ncbi:MAG: hypothetical protein AAF988_03140 [Pseudomonadota bacterium]
MPLIRDLPANYKLLLLGCIFVSSFGYVWDGYKQKSANACLERLEQSHRVAMANYDKASRSGNAVSKRVAAQYAGYLAQNSDKVCDGL